MPGTPTSPRTVSTHHDLGADVAGPIRRALRVLLASWAVRPDLIDDTLVVVEELVANVVDHACTPFRLTVTQTGLVLRVAVRDGSDRPPLPRELDPHSARGRGLCLITALTTDWGCQPHPTADLRGGRGKTIWAELAA